MAAAAVTRIAVAAASSAAAAAAAPTLPVRRAETSAQYEVYDARTSAQRSAIARTGASIDDGSTRW
jgi:carboxypeptidase T